MSIHQSDNALCTTIVLKSSETRIHITRFFFFNDPPPAEIYTLSLHDALPICRSRLLRRWRRGAARARTCFHNGDRKSTRLNSSHVAISYAVFCLKKKNYSTGHYTSQQQKTFVDVQSTTIDTKNTRMHTLPRRH